MRSFAIGALHLVSAVRALRNFMLFPAADAFCWVLALAGFMAVGLAVEALSRGLVLEVVGLQQDLVRCLLGFLQLSLVRSSSFSIRGLCVVMTLRCSLAVASSH